MRQHVDYCLRVLLGNFQGRFSDEMEAFWRDVETKYRACNVMMIPQEHIPIWLEFAKMAHVPTERHEPIDGSEPSAPRRGRPPKVLAGV